MNFFYISTKRGISGICKYSADFYELVLKDLGYIFIDSSEDLTTIFTRVTSKDNVHIEIGIFQKNEVNILMLMLKAGYKNVSITLHDAPLLKYPFKEYKNKLVNLTSKFYDRYIIRHKNSRASIQKIKAIYVLSQKGVQVTKKIYGVENVYFLPHIINPAEIELPKPLNKNFVYFGFIGKNKGIEYSLKLHAALLKLHPDLQFFVVGTAMGSQKKYYSYLKSTYTNNVHFLGYLKEEALKSVFEKASFALLLFKEYKFFYPASGSILHSLKKGKIVLTKGTNVINEIVTNGKNGFFLTGHIKNDVALIGKLFEDKELLKSIQDKTYIHLHEHYAPQNVSAHFNKKR